MTGPFRPLRQTLRALVRSPGYSLAAILMLGLGLGLVSYMFTAINAFVLRPLPFPRSEQLVHVELAKLSEGQDSIEVPLADFVDLRREQTSLGGLAAFSTGTVNLGGDPHPERLDGAFVTAEALATIGVRPLHGRTFAAGDDQPGAPAVAVLGFELWRDRFAADPAIVGRTARFNGREAVVVGVMPAGFRFPLAQQIWLPLTLDATRLERAGGTSVEVFGRLPEGRSLAAARAEIRGIVERLAAAHPETNAGLTAVVKPYAEEFVSAEMRRMLFTMFGAVVLVLLIACSNVANLVLARSVGRRRELAIRAALGARRRQLAARIGLESLLLAVAGGALGFALASAAARLTFRIGKASFDWPYWVNFALDWRDFACVAAAALAVTLMAGILPALRALRGDLTAPIRESGGGTVSSGLGRLGRTLVAAQVAFCCVVLTGTGLMVRSVVEVRAVRLGANVDGVLSGRIGLFETSYPTSGDRARFFAALETRLRQLPGVEAATVANSLPATFANGDFFAAEGAEPPAGRPPVVARVATAPGYFAFFRVSIQEGRDFTAHDGGDAAPVAIVNRRLAERFWPGESALGRRLRLGRDATTDPWRTVVGVVGDVQQDEVEDPLRPAVYLPLAQDAPRFVSLAVRAQGSPAALAAAVRQAVADLDRDLPVYWLRTIDEWIDLGRFSVEFLAAIFAAFGAVAFALAAVGLYALLAYAVSQRRREIGVRRALGARDAALAKLVLRQGLGQALAGVGVGVPLALAFGRLLSGELVGISPHDPATLLAVVVALVAVAALASWVPTRRALRLDPVVALRQE
jgi:putative ABC transport system permease protein